MNKFFKLITCLLLSFVIFSGCTSTKIKQEKQFLQGIIYDYNSEPVSGAEIFLLENDSDKPAKSVAFSDITGHFSINSIKNYKEYTLIAKRDSYEDSSLQFLLSNSSQIIYLRMYSYNQLLSLAEEKVALKDYDTAEAYIKRAEAVGTSPLSYTYLLAVINYLRGSYNEALLYCENLINQGFTNSYIYLLLADIYENGFGNKEKTIYYLEEYLKQNYNPDVEKRLDNLMELN